MSSSGTSTISKTKKEISVLINLHIKSLENISRYWKLAAKLQLVLTHLNNIYLPEQSLKEVDREGGFYVDDGEVLDDLLLNGKKFLSSFVS